MRKIRVKYKIFTGDYYTPVKYKQGTFPVEVPTDAQGFILVNALGKVLADKVREKEGPKFEIIRYQV